MRSAQESNPRQRLIMAIAVFTIYLLGVNPRGLSAERTEGQARSNAASVGNQTATDSLQDADTVDLRGMKIRVLDPDGEPIQGVRLFRNHVYKIKDDGRPIIENDEYFTDAHGKATIAFSGISLDLRLWATKEEKAERREWESVGIRQATAVRRDEFAVSGGHSTENTKGSRRDCRRPNARPFRLESKLAVTAARTAN